MRDVVVEKLMVVKDADTNRLYAVFSDQDDHLVVRGMGAGVEWAKWVTRRKLRADELAATLDPGLVIEGPVAPTQQMLKLMSTSEQQVKSAEVVAYHDWVNRTAAGTILEKARRRRGLADGLADGLEAGLRGVARALRGSRDGDGDGNYARDPDGIDDDPVPSAPGAVTRGLEAVREGAQAVEDIARGAPTRDTAPEDRTPMDARVLGALGRVVRPGGLRAERERIGEEVAERRARGAKRRGGVPKGYKPDSKGDGDGTSRRPSVKDMLRAIVRRDQKAIGARTADGWALPHVVPRGNKGIDSYAAAAKHLEDGGAIADVPDDFLAEAIMDNVGDGKRFRQLSVPNSVNDPEVLEDTTDGSKMILKYKDGKGASFDEDISEALGAHVAERFGFPQGTFRWAGAKREVDTSLIDPAIVNDSRAIATRMFEIESLIRRGQGTPELQEEYQQLENAAQRDLRARPVLIALADEQTDLPYDVARFVGGEGNLSLREKVRSTLLDAILLNIDRHDGNYLITEENEDGVPHFYPIDHGHALSRYQAFEPGGGLDALGVNVDQIYSNPIKIDTEDSARSSAEREKVLEEIAALQEDLRRAEQELSIGEVVRSLTEQAGVEDRPGVTDTYFDRRSIFLLEERIRTLLDSTPEEILEQLK